MDRIFPAKIILLGEYSVLLDQKAIAIPYQKVFAKNERDSLKTPTNYYKLLAESIGPLSALDFIDSDRLQEDYAKGYYVESSIPQGYGLGSSGAFCAAIYHRYRKEQITDLNIIHEQLLAMENLFHSSSSGIDPLVSYLDQAVVLNDGIRSIDKEIELSRLFLWDSQISRETSGLVSGFMEKLQDPELRLLWDSEYLPQLYALMETLLGGNDDQDQWKELSRLQLLLFADMIPTSVKQMWSTGFDSDEYYMKLCGAGGGGNYLLYVPRDKDRPSFSLSEIAN